MLPREDEYIQAVQNPGIAFSDPDFLQCRVETTPLGLPKPYSGGFTTTYKFSNQYSSWAARCFTRDVHNLQQRYQAISRFIAQTNSPYFVEAKFLPAGIKVNARLYPVIKMKWVEGELLNAFFRKNLNQPARLNQFISSFESLIRQLETWGIAHGDLQGGNILVQNNGLVLIDYDGMYFPELASLRANEIGHPDFQHPGRTANQFNEKLDRFAAIVIYLAANVLSLRPSLWNNHDNGENLLFTRTDFRSPQQSPLLSEISSIAPLQKLAQRFIGVCHLPFHETPRLQEFIDGNFKYTIPASTNFFAKQKNTSANSYSEQEAKVFGALYNNLTSVGPIPPAPVIPVVPNASGENSPVKLALIGISIFIATAIVVGLSSAPAGTAITSNTD